jgi:DNA-binding protein Fis
MLLLPLTLLVSALLPFQDLRAQWDTLRDGKDLKPRLDAVRAIVQNAAAENKCGNIVGELLEFAVKATTPPELRVAIAAELSACKDAKTPREIGAGLGKGQLFEQRFLMDCAQHFADEALDKDIRDTVLKGDESSLREYAVRTLVAHKYMAALPVMEAIVKDGKDREVLAAAVWGISQLRRNTPEWGAWEEKLVGLVTSKQESLRLAALAELAQGQNASHEPIFKAALAAPEWPARSIAIEWMVRQKSKSAVTALIEQFQKEQPGSRLHSDFAKQLGKLTGMPLGDDSARWAEWWSNSAETFEFPKSAGGARSKDAAKAAPPSGTSVAPRFYGMEINSLRVIFVIDVSGSMLDAVAELPKEYSHESGAKPSRIDVAKFELSRIVQALSPGSAFNIISFSTGVDAWMDGLQEALTGGKAGGKASGGPKSGREKEKSEKDIEKEKAKAAALDAELRKKAQGYIDGLGANGGTNLYDAMSLAFEDPLVDTIIVLSDGNPSAGTVIDPVLIREDVKRWNTVRKIKIHTVSIGTDFDLLKLLAQDSGGEHSFYR